MKHRWKAYLGRGGDWSLEGGGGTTASLGMNLSLLNSQWWQKKESMPACVDLEAGLLVCMCGSLRSPCLPAAGFCIQHKQPAEGLYEGDNMGGSREVVDVLQRSG